MEMRSLDRRRRMGDGRVSGVSPRQGLGTAGLRKPGGPPVASPATGEFPPWSKSYFKAAFAWRPPVAFTPLVGAKTTRLTRKTTSSGPRNVSHTRVLATRGPRDAARAHLDHDRPKGRGRKRCLGRASPCEGGLADPRRRDRRRIGACGRLQPAALAAQQQRYAPPRRCNRGALLARLRRHNGVRPALTEPATLPTRPGV
jgi:hypothetical protein